MGKRTAVDVIRDFYLDDRGRVTLSDKHEELRQRFIGIHSLMTNGYGPKEAMTIHAKRYEISDVQAWRDYRNALSLFGQVQKAEKEGFRYIVLEFLFRAHQLAEKQSDYEGMSRVSEKIMKLLGLDKEDPDLPDFEKIKPSLVVLGLPVEHEQRLRAMLGQGAVNLSQTYRKDYIPYEQVDEEE